MKSGFKRVFKRVLKGALKTPAFYVSPRVASLCVALIFGALLCGAPLIPSAAYAAYDYTIDGYQVMILVNENNTFDITENILARFHVPKHGIIRKLPKKNEVFRLDGTTSRNRAVISDVAVNAPYKSYIENNNLVLRIGDPDELITGPAHYALRYTYNIGKDTGKGYDEFYYNIIGAEWDTTIDNVFFTITMPLDFDKNKLGFSAGPLFSTESGNIDYTVDGRVITGRYNGTLAPGEGLTIRLELPEGYFTGAGIKTDILMIPALALIIAILFIYYRLWLARGGRPEYVVETVEFYPPPGLNSAEVGFWYKGGVESADIVSLLIYLANLGYIKISERKPDTSSRLKKASSRQDGFILTKLRDYDGDNAGEQVFLEELFQNKSSPASVMAKYMKERIAEGYKISRTIPGIDAPAALVAGDQEAEADMAVSEVTAEDLRNRFYITLDKIQSDMNSDENIKRVFENTGTGARVMGAFALAIIFLLITVRPVLVSAEPIHLLFAITFPGIGFTMLLVSLIWIKSPVKWVLAVFGVVYGGMPFYLIMVEILRVDPIYWISYGAGLACMAGIMILMKHMPKRTPEGYALLGKIRGFRNFLIEAEKPRLEALVMHDPEYFYHILPFTYVLGVSDKWIKKFETIALQPPSWYGGDTAFSGASFGRFMDTTVRSVNAAMSSGSSSGSGGSSGGGSSGGGSGGGGGSSW